MQWLYDEKKARKAFYELSWAIMSDLLYFETKLKLELVFLKSKTLEDSFSIFYNLMLIMKTYPC